MNRENVPVAPANDQGEAGGGDLNASEQSGTSAAPPLPAGEWSEVFSRFRLERQGSDPRIRPQVRASSFGGMKKALVHFTADGLQLQQSLTRTGFLIVFLFGSFPVGVVGAVIDQLWSLLDRRGDHMLGVLIAHLVMMVLLLFVCARRARRISERIPFSQIIGAHRGLDCCVEIRASSRSPSRAATTEGTTTPPTQISANPGEELILTLSSASPEAEARLISALKGGGVAVDNRLIVEQETFDQQLKEATPRTWVAKLFIVVNVLVFLGLRSEVGHFKFSPTLALLNWGADFGPLTVTAHEWWRLVTACFLHFGVLHLILNLFALYQISQVVERLFGNICFSVIYFGCGLTASLASLVVHPNAVSVGASGAVFGLYGALLGYLMRERNVIPRTVVSRLATGALLILAYNVLYGLLAYVEQAGQELLHPERSGGVRIDQTAHLGGFLSGLVFGYLAALPLEPGRRLGLLTRRLAGLGVGIFTVTVPLGVYLMVWSRDDFETLSALGRSYVDPRLGVESNAKGIGYLERAGEAGHLGSQQILGKLYYEGKTVGRDLPVAFKWFSKAADQGDEEAKAFLPALDEEISRLARDAEGR